MMEVYETNKEKQAEEVVEENTVNEEDVMEQAPVLDDEEPAAAKTVQQPVQEPVQEATYRQAMRVLRELRNLVETAPKAFLRANECMLSRKEMLDRMELLQQVMPSAIGDADGLLQKCDAVIADAQARARQIEEDARKNAESILGKAETSRQAVEQQMKAAQMDYQRIQQEMEAYKAQKEQEAQQSAAATVNDARMQADQIVRYAKQQQDEMVSRETVYRRAEVEANELLEKNRAQMEQLRQKTFAYLDELLGQGEKYVSDIALNVNNLSQNIHTERENLSSRR